MATPYPEFSLSPSYARSMFIYVLSLLFAILLLSLARNLHRFCLLEATDSCGAKLLMDCPGNIGLSNILIALLRGNIRTRLFQEVDPDISITQKECQSANISHPTNLLAEDWQTVANAALSSARQMIQHFEDNGSAGGTPLPLFIRSVIMATLLHLFFGIPTTPANIEDVVWIIGEPQRADAFQPYSMPQELFRLVKPSPDPSGIFPLLSTIQRLVLAAICTMECKGEKIHFLRQAGALLNHPISPEPDITKLVEEVRRSNPPIQLIRGRYPLGPFPFCGTFNIDFFIPVEILPPSACILSPDGSCTSWLHKAAVPGQPACGSEKWLTHATAIILSAVETEIRQACLTIDGDTHGPDSAWEDWVLRRLRVG